MEAVVADAPGKLPPETQKAVDEFVAVAARNARLRREIAKAERPKRIGRALAVVLAAYFLLWLGGSVSYNYTHECVRSHIIPGDPGDRDPDTHQGGGDKTVCDCDGRQRPSVDHPQAAQALPHRRPSPGT
jgi:hypothetical protein